MNASSSGENPSRLATRWYALARRAINRRHISFAQLRRRLDKRFEYRLQIEGRAADHLEHGIGGVPLRSQFVQLTLRLRQLIFEPD